MSNHTLYLPSPAVQASPPGESVIDIFSALAYVHPTDAELLKAGEIVARANQHPVVEACHNLMLRWKDFDTVAHCGRVAWLSTVIGLRAGLTDRELTVDAEGALMHDVARSIPEIKAIADSPKRFEGAERQVLMGVVHQHAELGAAIVHSFARGLEEDAPLTEIVGGHHTASDVDPYGILPNRFRLETEILALADGIDGLATKRPYKPAFSLEKTRAILEAEFTGDPLLLSLCFGAAQFAPSHPDSQLLVPTH